MSHIWWALQHCTGFARLVWGRLRVHQAFIYASVMSHVCIHGSTTRKLSQVTHMHESWHTCEWVMSHVWMSHIAHMHESCLTYEWVMSHIPMSHISRMNESCHAYEWVMSHIWRSHVTHMSESNHIYERVMSQYINQSFLTYQWVMSHIWMRPVAHMNESCHTYECDLSTICMSSSTHMTQPFRTHINELCHTYLRYQGPGSEVPGTRMKEASYKKWPHKKATYIQRDLQNMLTRMK